MEFEGWCDCSIDGGKHHSLSVLHLQDKENVMTGRPWCFKQRLLLLQEIAPDTQPTEVNFYFLFVFHWVRLYNLSFGFRLNERVKTIACLLGEVMDIEEELMRLTRSIEFGL